MGEHGLIEAIVEEHRRIEARLDALSRARPDERAGALDALVHLLVTHELAEQHVVHPIVRARSVAGSAVAQARLDEERVVEAILEQLVRDGGRHRSVRETLGHLSAELLRHLELEERTVLPLLRVACDEVELASLAAQFERVRALVVTAEARAPGAATEPVATVVDRAHEAVQAAFAATDPDGAPC